MNSLWVLLFVLIGGAESTVNYDVSCNSENITLKLNRTYLNGLTSAAPEAVYLIDPVNFTLNEACRSFQDGDYFVIVINDTNRDTCFANITNTNNSLINAYTARLVTSGSSSASIVSYDAIYQWMFSCHYQNEYNVTAGPVQPFKVDFIFNKTANGSFGSQIQFYSDASYNTIVDITQKGYKVGDLIYVQVSIDAPDQLLQVKSCKLTNINTATVISLIENSCPVRRNTVFDPMPTPNNNTVRFRFMAETFSNVAVSQQFHTLTCEEDICQNSMGQCTQFDYSGCPTIAKRSIKERPERNTIRVSNTFRIVPACSLKCEEKLHQTCKTKISGKEVCDCMDGYQMQDDKKTCLEVSDYRNRAGSQVPDSRGAAHDQHEINEQSNGKSFPESQLSVVSDEKVFAENWQSVLFYTSVAVLGVVLFAVVIILFQQHYRRRRLSSYKMLNPVLPRQES